MPLQLHCQEDGLNELICVVDDKVQWVLTRVFIHVQAHEDCCCLYKYLILAFLSDTYMQLQTRSLLSLNTLFFFSAKNFIAKLSTPVLPCTLPSSSISSSQNLLFSLLPRRLTQHSPLWNWNSWSCWKCI